MPMHTRPYGPRGAGVALAAALALAGTSACGRAAAPTEMGTGAPAAAASPAAPAAPSGPTLPTLPPIRQGRPEAFDASGCLQGPPVSASGSPRCTTTADQLDAQRAGASADDWRDLAGFTGTHYATDLRAGAPVVLTDSVRSGPTAAGTWAALGLARNQSAATIATLSVTAQLVGPDGTVVGTATATSPVGNVRPGEPVPFQLASDVPASGVASVRWTAGSDPAAPAPASRAFQIATFWTRPAGGRPMEGPLHQDHGSAASHLVFGSVTNLGPATAGADVVGAWLDRSGRVAFVAASPGLSGAAAAATVPAGGFADFLLEVPAPTAAAVAELTPLIWAVGR